MSRILILAVVGLLLFGAPLAADQMLQNEDVEPADADDLADQESFTETTAAFYEATPYLLVALVIGAMLAAVRVVGGGGL